MDSEALAKALASLSPEAQAAVLAQAQALRGADPPLAEVPPPPLPPSAARGSPPPSAPRGSPAPAFCKPSGADVCVDVDCEECGKSALPWPAPLPAEPQTGHKAQAAAEDFMRALELDQLRPAYAILAHADLRHRSEAGWTPVHWAVHAASTALAVAQPQEPPTTAEEEEEEGPVGCACCEPTAAGKEARPLLRRVLEAARAADVVDVRSSDGATPLMFAADAGDAEACGWLLAAGADPTLEDDDGDRASAWARAHKHTDLAERLERTQAGGFFVAA